MKILTSTLCLIVLFVQFSSAQPGFQEGVCKTVVWINDKQGIAEKCFDAGQKIHWYGGGSTGNQYWPVVIDFYDDPQTTDDVLNRINNRVWFSSEGYAIKVEDQVPLFLREENANRKFCFKAMNKAPYNFDADDSPNLAYTQCFAKNMAFLYYTLMPMYFELPEEHPDEYFFRYPVWSTSPALTVINQTTILQFAKDIVSHLGPQTSTLIIDYGWEACRGDLLFDSSKFPKPKELFDSLSSMGFKVVLHVHPHVETRCSSFNEGRNKGYFVVNDQNEPATGKWDDLTVGMVNMFDDSAVNWWKAKLLDLKVRYKVDSFFFNRGQSTALPTNYTFGSKVNKLLLPDYYSTKYAEVAASLGKNMFIDVGRNSQKHPMFVEMIENDRSLEYGLSRLLADVFQTQINGFPFILPAVAGGIPRSEHERLDKNAYIRWFQLNAFLPVMHLSTPPWALDQEVVDIFEDSLRQREKFWTSIQSAIKQVKFKGTPIIRPMFWNDPRLTTDAYKANDQFMIGDDLLVAPLLNLQEQRNIYFPPGIWKDNLKGRTFSYIVPTVVSDYPVKLNEISTFSKLGDV